MACLKETIRADMQLAAELKAALCTPDYVMKDSGGGGGLIWQGPPVPAVQEGHAVKPEC